MKRKLRQMNDSASIGTYVLILFGMTVVLYMFGFTNSMMGPGGYLSDASVNGTNLTDSNMQQANNPLAMFVNALVNFMKNNVLNLGVGIAGVVITLVLAKFAGLEGVITAITNYLIPIALLGIVLNLFVFPLSSLDAELGGMTFWAGTSYAVPLSWFIIMFFNLFFVLAVLEYIRTGTTT